MSDRSKTSQYYGVCFNPIVSGGSAGIRWGNSHPWYAQVKRNGTMILKKHFPTEREAAMAVDRCLIERGEEPRNILKRK